MAVTAYHDPVGAARAGESEVTVRRFLRGIGWAFIGMGGFVLYFLVYQLVGTNAITDHSQSQLRDQLEKGWSGPGGIAAKAGGRVPVIPEGTGFAIIQIPKIAVNRVIVQGVNRQDLAKGPGHIPSTVMPGQLGTFAVSGHRTTHGAPFYNLDKLKNGDQIIIITKTSIFTYVVTGHKIVLPSDTSVLNNVRGPDGKLKATITLTTCNPKFKATQRLIIFGALADTKPNDGQVAA
jgi:sortase A